MCAFSPALVIFLFSQVIRITKTFRSKAFDFVNFGGWEEELLVMKGKMETFTFKT